ncbi:MAG: hypothetical protein ACRDMI_01600 [Streptosporangiaceae bacterium]
MSHQTEAAGTIDGVITDLARLVRWMPVSQAQCQAGADILDRLATEAAALLRKV